jgi:hypothetical protein
MLVTNTVSVLLMTPSAARVEEYERHIIRCACSEYSMDEPLVIVVG